MFAKLFLYLEDLEIPTTEVNGTEVPVVSPEFLYHGIGILLMVLLSLLGAWIARVWVLKAVRGVVRKTRFKWDDVLVDHNVFFRFSHIVPALVVDHLAEPFFGQLIGPEGMPLLPGSWFLGVLELFVSVYLVVIVLLVFDGVLSAVGRSVEGRALSRKLPVRGIMQALKLVVNFVGLVYIVAFCFGKSPVAILSGLGAMTAVLMLVFRDSLLGLVAGFQLSLNNMVQKGDWIEMGKFGVDGEVLDVSLNVVRVQNWDKTISSIPTHELASNSFKNWRGMSESGGRRIKRALHLDVRTVRFVDGEMLEKFKSFEVLKSHLEKKLAEVDAHNKDQNCDMAVLANGRRLTNLGTFRAYCVAYLQANAKIHKEGMTFLVRQLAPGPEGIGIEIYVFSNDTGWVAYEGIQADIFDHLLAVLPEFGLAPFQNLTGGDLAGLWAGAKA